MYDDLISEEFDVQLVRIATYYERRSEIAGPAGSTASRFAGLRQLLASAESAEMAMMVIGGITGDVDAIPEPIVGRMRGSLATLIVEFLSYLGEVSPDPARWVKAYASQVADETDTLLERMSDLEIGDVDGLESVLEKRRDELGIMGCGHDHSDHSEFSEPSEDGSPGMYL